MKISDIELTKEQIRILKLLKKGKILDKSDFNFDVLNPFFENGFLKYELYDYNGIIDYEKGKLFITQCGIDWIELRKKSEFRFWYPHIVATIALIISVIALLKP